MKPERKCSPLWIPVLLMLGMTVPYAIFQYGCLQNLLVCDCGHPVPRDIHAIARGFWGILAVISSLMAVRLSIRHIPKEKRGRRVLYVVAMVVLAVLVAVGMTMILRIEDAHARIF